MLQMCVTDGFSPVFKSDCGLVLMQRMFAECPQLEKKNSLMMFVNTNAISTQLSKHTHCETTLQQLQFQLKEKLLDNK